jgi:hypothetical protein
MKFWNASAIVPLCLREPATPRLRRIAEDDGALVAWWATPVECYSAFARLRRGGVLSSNSEERARGVLRRLTEEWTELELTRQVRENGRPAGHDFVCLDERLREAASREGFVVLP